jgi:hypothetical protein
MSIKPIKVPITAVDNYSLAMSKFTAKVKGLHAPVKKISAEMKNVGRGFASAFSSVAKIGAVGVGAGAGLIALVKSSAEAGNSLLNASKRMGISVEALQELRYAATQSDIDIEAFDQNLERMGRNAAKAAAGVKQNSAVFNALGVRVKDASGKMRSIDDIFTDVTSAMEKLPDPLTKNRVAVELFGKSGGVMIQMLSGGTKELLKQREAARRLGIISTENAEATATFDSAYKDLMYSLTNTRNIFAGQLFPMFTGLSQQLTEILVKKRPEIIAFGKSLAENLPGILKNIGDASRFAYETIVPMINVVSKIAKIIGPANLAFGIMSFVIVSKLVPAIVSLVQVFKLLNVAVIGSPLSLALAGLTVFGVAVAATVGHFASLNKEYERMAEMKKKFGNGPVEIKTSDQANTAKISRLNDLYIKSLKNNGNSFTEADYAEQTRLEKELTSSGFDIGGQDFQTRINKVSGLWAERSGANRNSQWLNNGGQATVRVEFKNTPPGTNVNVSESDIPIDLKMGYNLVQP